MTSTEDHVSLVDLPSDVRKILFMDFWFIESEHILGKSSDLSTQVRTSGNELFKQKNHDETIHRDILSYYTKSIAIAPKKTEELASGYSNRSVLLKHLQRYKECLIDIDKAYEITESAQLKKKLQNRKKECSELLSNLKATQPNLEESMENLALDGNTDQNNTFIEPIVPSDVVPGASESVALNYNDTSGRHFIATRDIRPGEIIINEKGYICYPFSIKELYLYCSHCLKFSWNAIPCDNCIYAVYCSETCKNEALEDYHDEECSILPYLYFIIIKANIVDVMATTRLLIKAIKKEGLDNVLNEARIAKEKNDYNKHELLSDGILNNGKFRSYYNLTYDEEVVRSNESLEYELAAINLLFRHTNLISTNRSEFHVTPQEAKILQELKNLFARLKRIFNSNATSYPGTPCDCSNSVECRKKCSVNRGLVIGPCSSLINHSCAPNVERICLPQGKIVLYSIAPIKKGEQICVTYVDYFTTEKVKRQKLLQDNFSFSCKCTACLENWPTYEGVDISRDREFDRHMLQTYPNLYNEECSSFFNNVVEDIELDVKAFKDAIEYNKWVYERYEKSLAYRMSLPYKAYIVTAFKKLFEENCIVPASCCK